MAFDYRQFLAENKLTKVSKGQETGKAQILSEGVRIREGFDTPDTDLEMDEAKHETCPECGQDPCVCEANKQKEDYLKRKEREEKGNWEGSVGAFVEKHGDEIAKLKTFKDIDEYINWNMAPEVGDEGYEYLLNLRQNSKSPYKFIMALYNATLKGSGLGLDEASACHECDGWDETEEVAWEDNGDEYPVEDEYLSEAKKPTDEAVNHASLGGERNRKKPGVKPGLAGQDKMAKDEMKGDKIKVTMKDGTVKYMTKAEFTKYKNELKAKKEQKTLKEGLEGGDKAIADTLRAIYNHFTEDDITDLRIQFNDDNHPGFAVITKDGGRTELKVIDLWEEDV